MSDEYMEAVAPLIEDTIGWAVKRYNVQASGVMSTEDLRQELLVAAWVKREKLQPRLEDGEVGYVARALQNAARDALAPDWAHQKKAGGTVEDLETGSLASSGFSNKTEYMHHRTEAGRNPEPPSVKLLRTARTDFESAWAQMRQHRDAAHVIAALMPTLDEMDAAILRLFLGSWISPEESWVAPGSKTVAIALEIGRSERTVRRRLAAILGRVEVLLKDLEVPEAG